MDTLDGKAVIRTRDLSRRFGDTLAVAGLSLDVFQGEVFGFLGHNGAGKTTTVRLFNGVLSPSGGALEVLGLSPVTDGPALRRRTGVLTETPSLDERLTGRENLSIYADLYGVPTGRVAEQVGKYLDFFELSARGDDKVGGYSNGMKQRLALARALLHEPELVFLDEPTSGLDPVTTRKVHQMIEQMSAAEGRTVFMCTHNLVEAKSLCDRVAVLENGEMIALGTPSELARQIAPSQRVRVEVDPEDREAALEVGRSNAHAVQAFLEDGVVIVQGLARQSVPDLIAALVSQGVRIYEVTPEEASLEHVYFALHSREEVSA